MNTLQWDPQKCFRQQSLSIQDQLESLLKTLLSNHCLEAIERSSELQSCYQAIEAHSQPTYHSALGQFFVSDNTYTYAFELPIHNSYLHNDPCIARFLRLALINRVSSHSEVKHAFLALPIETHGNTEETTFFSKYPLQQKTFEDLIKEPISFQQWNHILASLYLALEHITFLGVCLDNLSLDSLWVTLESSYVKISGWENFIPTSDNQPQGIRGLFGAIHYLPLFCEISNAISTSTNLSEEDRVTLLRLPLNLLQILYKYKFFYTLGPPSEKEILELNNLFLTELQNTLQATTLQDSLISIFKHEEIPETQKERLRNHTKTIAPLQSLHMQIAYAIELGFKEFIEVCLLSNEIDSNHQQNALGETLLLQTCKYGRSMPSAIIKLLLQHQADPNIADLTGNTPLIEAIQQENHRFSYMLMQQLLKAGAYPNTPNAIGMTPFTYCLHFTG